MKRISLSTLIPLTLVAACGGSGSGGDNTVAPPIDLDITPDNAVQVAQEAYRAVVSSGDIADLAGNSGLTAGGGGNLTKATTEQLKGTLASLVQQDPFGPITLPCAVSGDLTISGNLAIGLTLTAGDTIRADYNNCDDGAGETLDGTLDFSVDAFSGDVLSGLYNMTMTMDVMNFQSTTATDVLTANGDGTAVLNTLLAPYVEASVSGGSMTTDTNGAAATLSVYSSAQTLDARLEPAPYTMIASGTLDSSDLAGIVAYSTTVMFEGSGSDYPNAGELLVDGATSSARLTALNSVDVRIEIDTDGDGTVDETILTTWAELDGV